MYRYVDRKNKFVEMFDPKTGFYVRSGVFDENGKDTGIDPFMRQFPSLIDVGIMQKCVCSKYCNVNCYQKACDRTGDNMSLENYVSILEQCKGKVFQLALGGAGDVDTHENFEDIMRITREYNIVPNFTTSGICMTKEKAEICKKYAGAVAVSEHYADYTEKALNLLLDAGVTTNIHFVLNNQTIDDAIDKLKNNGFKKGINAVVFLTYKPVGLGVHKKMLDVNDPRVKEFFALVDDNNCDCQLGFDSCAASGIVNFTRQINLDSLDFCEGARFSMYIDANMNAMPCSFANQNPDWFVDLHTHTIQEAWNSEVFERFRYSLRHSCSGCSKRNYCAGGCPLVNEITLCNNSCREFKRSA